MLKAVSLGPWVHLIEELQVFDQEPVESLVLSQSKVVSSAPHPHPTPLSPHLPQSCAWPVQGWGDAQASPRNEC